MKKQSDSNSIAEINTPEEVKFKYRNLKNIPSPRDSIDKRQAILHIDEKEKAYQIGRKVLMLDLNKMTPLEVVIAIHNIQIS